MARKTIAQLLAQSNADLPDNVTGLITPAKLRVLMNDFLETVAPAYAGLVIPGQVNDNINGTYRVLPWTSVQEVQNPEFTADAPTGKITRTQTDTANHISVSIDFDAPVQMMVYLTVYANGVATNWTGSAVGMGNGANEPSHISFEALHRTTVATDYQIYVRGSQTKDVIWKNGIFLINSVPVRQ
jgi:hypothetical protein